MVYDKHTHIIIFYFNRVLTDIRIKKAQKGKQSITVTLNKKDYEIKVVIVWEKNNCNVMTFSEKMTTCLNIFFPRNIII